MNIYLWDKVVWEKTPTPSYIPYEVNANTYLYAPLTSTTTTSDTSWNNRNFTNTSVTFWTYDWVDCAAFNGSSQLLYTAASNPIQREFTIMFWCRSTATEATSYVWRVCTSAYDGSNNAVFISDVSGEDSNTYKNILLRTGNVRWHQEWQSPTKPNWIYIWLVCYESWGNTYVKQYWKWTWWEWSTGWLWSNYVSDYPNINIWWNPWFQYATSGYYWYISEVVVEKWIPSRDTFLQYYENQKGKFGITD